MKLPRQLRFIAAALAFAALLAGLACSRTPERPELREIPRPDSSGAEPAVQEKIAAARARLESLLADRNAAPADLAAAFGDLGFVYLTYEFLEASDASFENAGRIEPEARRWVYLQGLIAKMRGEAPRAKGLLERALEMEPRNAVTLVRLGDTELELGNTAEARARFEQALAIDAQSAAALDGLGKVAAATGETERAIELFSRALELQPGATSLHYSLSQAYRRLGKMEEAQYHLVRRGEATVTVDDPVLEPIAKIGASVHLELAKANRAMEDRRYDAAADAFRRTIELDPGDLAARRGLAVALYELGDPDAATEHLEEALRRVSGDDETARGQRLEILRTLIGLHLRSNRDDLAIAGLERLLAIDPERLEARAELGDAFARSGELDRAVAEYDRVLRVEPHNAIALVKRATARINLGRVEAGLRDFEQAVASAPAEPAIRLRYAEALDHLGRADAAAAQRAAASKAGREASGEGDRAHFLAEEARRATAAGRFDDAARSYRQALETAPGDDAIRLELAKVLGHSKQFDQAEIEFTKVIAGQPRSEQAWRGRVLSLVLGGKLDAAKVVLRDALRIFPRDSAMANGLARLLATADAPEVRDASLALELSQRVHRVLLNSTSAETLAAALAESGRFAEAVELQRRVADQAPAGPAGDLARARLKTYERGEPWRLESPTEIADLVAASNAPPNG
jgi:tetratricopeptide (TPR) repeat protein